MECLYICTNRPASAPLLSPTIWVREVPEYAINRLTFDNKLIKTNFIRTKKHEIPISSIPCLQYKKELEKDRERDREREKEKEIEKTLEANGSECETRKSYLNVCYE